MQHAHEQHDGAHPAAVTIRPLRPQDAAEAAAVARTALTAIEPEDVPAAEEPARVAAGTARVAHLQRTGPGGCWVAEADGRLVGTAIGLIRDGVWGLSLFAVLPDFQGAGSGAGSMRPPRRTERTSPAGSSSPLRIRPRCAATPSRPATGCCPPSASRASRDAQAAPAAPRCRAGELVAARRRSTTRRATCAAASHLRDLPTLLDAPDRTLLVIDGEGFACVRDGTPALLAARSEAAAEDLLWGAITSGTPGRPVSVELVTAGNQWAIRVGLAAGLAIVPNGPMFVRGEIGPLAPHLASGAYL